MAESLTFEAVDQIVQKADLTRFQPGGVSHIAAVGAAPGEIVTKLCGIWQIVGPIIRLIMKAPLIPQKWRDALGVFANLMDTVCKP